MKARAIFRLTAAFLLGLQLFLPLMALAEGEDDPLWNKPSYEKKIIQIGQRILAANGIKERIAFHYVPKDVRNADARRWFSPNTIRVFKDITDIVSSDDELAAVMSHEIAHIVNRHTRKAILTKMPIILGTTALAGVATIATGGLAAPIVVELGGKALSRPIDRSLETDADLTGLDLMVKAGYNPLAMETFMTKLTADSGLVTAFFSTHPQGTKRIAHIHKAIQQKYPEFLTDELVNNPLPGSPYQFQPKTGSKASVQLVNKPADPATDSPNSAAAAPMSPSPISEEKKALYERLDQLAHPEKVTAEAALNQASSNTGAPSSEAITAVGLAESTSPETAQPESAEKSPLKTAPLKISYTPPPSALKKSPSKQDDVDKTTVQKPSIASAEPVSHPASESSIALILLELNADQQKALKLVAQRHYISREDLDEYFPGWDAELLNGILNGLINKRLIRIVGGDPSDHGYVLTDAAAAVLETTQTKAE